MTSDIDSSLNLDISLQLLLRIYGFLDQKLLLFMNTLVPHAIMSLRKTLQTEENFSTATIARTEMLLQRISVRGWFLTSCCELSFISDNRRNRTEFDYYNLFDSASVVIKPNPLSNRIIEFKGREFESHIWRGVMPTLTSV
jgi:hypothetical protein